MKILFESSIFLHQPIGGISKYFCEINKILNNLYKNSGLFISPSKNEGFGLTPLEAMSFGVQLFVVI